MGFSTTGISCQPGLPQPVPGAVLTWEGSHFMRAGLSLGYGPWPAQVHSCALLFLRLVLGGGVWPGRREAWLSPSAGTSSPCVFACHLTSLHLSFPHGHNKGQDSKTQGSFQ